MMSPIIGMISPVRNFFFGIEPSIHKGTSAELHGKWYGKFVRRFIE